MSEKKKTSIGGQAVIEGVMMRGPFKTAVSVRKPNGEIVMKLTENKIKGGFRKIPILRGIFGFVNSMVIGINSLMYSAQFYEEDGTPKKEEENEDDSIDNNQEVKEEVNNSNNKGKKDSSELSGFALFLTLVSSLALSIGLFIVVPTLVSGGITKLVYPDNAIVVSGDTFSGEKAFASVSGDHSGDIVLAGVNDEIANQKNILASVIENIVKIVIFIGYLALVSQMKDIKRVFEYHGAEHKTIFCYENGEELTVENVKKYKRFHPRCGTSFLLFVIIISIIFYSIVGSHPNILIRILIRLALLPLIAGVSYEIIKFAGKYSDNKFISWLNKPGMWLQRLTTREPDDSQIEVAIHSLKAVIPDDKNADLW